MRSIARNAVEADTDSVGLARLVFEADASSLGTLEVKLLAYLPDRDLDVKPSDTVSFISRKIDRDIVLLLGSDRDIIAEPTVCVDS